MKSVWLVVGATSLLLMACGDDDMSAAVDSGPFDSGPRADSGGTVDSGRPPFDAGPMDSGSEDAGPTDSGTDDAGAEDAGPGDAGSEDAGDPCGNGVMDEGETCDPMLNACCESDCSGPVAAGGECRASVDECDAAETCDGISFECPDDVSVTDGTDCIDCGGPTDCQCLNGACDPLVVNCDSIKTDYPAAPDGTYWIDPDGAGGTDAFQVYCEMTTDGGGWTLVDNDAVTEEVFTSREPGANPDITITRGSLLPAYTWSSSPKVLCKSDVYDGTLGWVTLVPTNAQAMTYPTTATGADYADTWTVGELNGNTDQGVTSYIFVTAYGNFGAFWVGGSFTPTCACDYSTAGGGGYTSLGAEDVTGDMATCSTWVR